MDSRDVVLANVERTVATGTVANVHGLLAPSKDDALSRESRVAPTARHAREHARRGAVLSLEPECAGRTGERQLLVGEVECA